MRSGLILSILFATFAVTAIAADAPAPWNNTTLSPDDRAKLLDQALTPEERIGLLHGIYAVPVFGKPLPAGAVGSAGFIPGIDRLGVPAQQESDASLGVANPFNVRPGAATRRCPRAWRWPRPSTRMPLIRAGL